MPVELIVVGFAVVAIAVARFFAMRHLDAGDARFVWLLFLPALALCVGMIWAAIQLLTVDLLMGILAAALALLFVALITRFILGFYRAESVRTRGEDVSEALLKPMEDSLIGFAVVPLIGGVIAVVALIAWGLLQAAD